MGRPKKAPEPCTAEGCGGRAIALGLCRKHYTRHRRTGRAEGHVALDKRSHPLYSIWWERRKRGSLCPEWAASLEVFAAAVGDRPTLTHLLRKLRGSEPYGPGNFEWMDALKRQAGETKKAFNARKWASRCERFPELGRARDLKRKYGITPEEFAAMLEAQKGVCFICEEPETRLHPKTHAPQQLAVDHCHATRKVRGLLCWRCNTILGKVDDSPELLQKMIDYLTGAWTGARGNPGPFSLRPCPMGRSAR